MSQEAIPLVRGSSERRFYTGMALAMLAVVLVGFARSFFLRPLFPAWPSPTEKIFYVHGAAFATWILLLVLQTRLVANGKTGIHRRIGWWGAGLATAMVVLGVLGALTAARRPSGFIGIPVPPLRFLAIPLFDMVLFPSFVGLAIARRADPQSHKRWMLLASMNLLTAAIARWPGVAALGLPAFFGLTDLFLVPLAVWDFASRGRLHAVTAWGGLATLLSQPVRLMVSGTAAWMAFAGWAAGLLG